MGLNYNIDRVATLEPGCQASVNEVVSPQLEKVGACTHLLSPPQGYLESYANVSSWLGTTCDKKGAGWFIPGQCQNGHRFAKEVVCGKEWCSVCGEDDSVAHNRRFLRWLPKIQQFKGMGYFVFTLPEDIRGRYRTKKALAELGHVVQELLKCAGYSRGLRRWHWFGEKSNKWHPHLNVLVDGGFISLEKLEYIKAAYARVLGVDLADVNYHYRRSAGQMVHTLKYVTRATFRDYTWDIDMALELRDFRNMVVWGRGKWDDEAAWSVADLQGKARADIEGLDIESITKLVAHECPLCGERVKWGKALPIGLLNMVRKFPLGAGYYVLDAWHPPCSSLTRGDKTRLYWLELIRKVQESIAIEGRRHEASIEAEYQEVFWKDLLQ
jgi:hypothetical protein